VDALIRRFEDCTLPQAEWHHRQHLQVALHYLVHAPEHAEELMCAGIQKLNAAHGVPQTPTGGYHHTLTIAWLRVLRARLREGAAPQELLEEDGQQLLRYYSQAAIMSWEARTGWVPPDREALPEGDPR
jgi:hypothetical protein